MKQTSIIILTLALMGLGFGGGPFDHTVQAFGNFKKPMSEVTWWDRARAAIDHAKTDAIIAENGKNLMLTQGVCSILAYNKAKAMGYGPQYKEAMLWGNGFDIVDKLLTGGAIAYQLEQVPVVGEYLALLFPSWTQTEIIHAIPGYPQPQYSMTEQQYYAFQALELLFFYWELDGLRVRNNTVAMEIPL